MDAPHTSIVPALADPGGATLGLDAHKMAAASEPVRIQTSIAHRDGTAGWIGIGVATAPVTRFEAAVAALDML